MNTHDAYTITVSDDCSLSAKGADKELVVLPTRTPPDRSLSAQVTDKEPDTQQSRTPPLANAGRVEANSTHANPPTLSKQVPATRRRKLAMAGAGGASEVKSCR